MGAGDEDGDVADFEASDLVMAALRGDKASWEALVYRYSGLVWSVARGYRLSSADSADVFQTTWLRLVEHLGRLSDPGQVGAWLATTARHEALRIARGVTRTVLADDATLVALGHVDDRSPERAALEAEQGRLDAARAAELWRAFGGLSARCRELLRLLVASPPPSYLEVAAALDMPVGSIGPTRARCLRRLRDRLAGDVSDTASRPHEDD